MSSLRGYRSVLSAVFRFHLPSFSSDQVLRMLLRSFQLSSAECVLRPHTWGLPLPKWVGELQALSSMVTFVAGDDCLSYIPQLVTKSESLTRSFPRSFLVTSLADFAAGLDYDLLLCPVRAFRVPSAPCSPFSTNAVSFFWGGGGNCCCSGG